MEINRREKIDHRLIRLSAMSFPEIVSQWHPTKNGDLTPKDVTPGSVRKVWWICEKDHEWEAVVGHRTRRGDRCPYCSGKRTSPEYNLKVKFPDVAAQWHPEKNGKLTPYDVTPGSGKKVWWNCPNDHEWEASVNQRTKLNPTGIPNHIGGCPYCFGRDTERLFSTRVYTEFQKLFGPDQVQREFAMRIGSGRGEKVYFVDVYLPKYNIAIEIGSTEYESDQKRMQRESYSKILDGPVFWAGTNGDHLESMIALANSMLADMTIPGEVRMILGRYVDSNILVNEEKYIQELTFGMRGRGPNLGESLGDIIEYMIESGFEHLTDQYLMRGFGPSIDAVDPMQYDKKVISEVWAPLMEEWDGEKNGDLTIYDVYPGAKKKAWWKCDKGHSWHALIKNRTSGSGCPKCSRSRVDGGNDLASRIEEVPELSHLKQEWMNAKNVDEFGLTLSDVTPASNKNVWWKCEKAGHEWETRIANRVNGTGCPICAGRKWKTTEAVRGVVDAADYDKVVPQIESVVNEHLQEGDRRMEELQRELSQLEMEKDILEQKLKLQREVKELKKQIQEKGSE